MLIQGLTEERQVGIGKTGTESLGAVEGVRFNGMTNGIGMDTKLLGDGADFPMLSEEPLPDLGAGFCINHQSLSSYSAGWGERDRRNDRSGHRPHSEEKAADALATVLARTAAPET